MKKRNLKSLRLNKRAISNFETSITGGATSVSQNKTKCLAFRAAPKATNPVSVIYDCPDPGPSPSPAPVCK